MDPFQRMSPAETVTELRNLISSVDFALTLDELRPLFYRADTLAKQHPDNSEVQTLLIDVKRAIAARGNAIKQGTAERPAAPAERPLEPPPPASPADATRSSTLITPVSPDSMPTAAFDVGAFRSSDPPPPGAPPKVPPPAQGLPFGTQGNSPASPFPTGPQQPVTPSPMTQRPPAKTGPPAGSPTAPSGPPTMPPRPGTRPPTGSPAQTAARTPAAAKPPVPAKKKSSLVPLLIVGALVWVLALGAGAYWYFFLRTPGSSTPGLIAIQFSTNPQGAAVRINHELKGTSNLSVELPPGEHKLEVVLDGYEPAVSSIVVGEGQPTAVNLDLVPRPQSVRFYTDLAEGGVFLDDQPAGALAEGQLVLDSVAPGPHTVRVTGGKSEVSFSFELKPGQAPTLTSAINASNILAVIVSNAGRQAFARSSRLPMKVGLNGEAAGEIGEQGLTLDNITPGDHELTLGEGADARKLVVSFGPSPVLTAFLKLDLNAGTLVVVTGEDGSIVHLNGRPYRVPTRRGAVRIPNLAVSDYMVSVTKDGFERTPDQLATIRKGAETRLEFQLKPVQRMAAMRIRGAPSGASVLLDGKQLGSVNADGTFSAGNIVPGEHVIEIRRDRYQPRRIQQNFPAGGTVEIPDAALALERTPATLRLQLSPADSRVVLRAAAGGGERLIRETTLSLPEGSYTIIASAPNHTERSATIQVASGESVTVDLRLSRQAARAKTIGMEGWAQPGQWTQRGSWTVQRGGNYVLFGHAPVNGAFTFTSAILRGGRLQIVANYKDARNFVLLQLDDDDYWRKVSVNGRQRELFKAKHGVDKKQGYFTLSLDLLPSTLALKVFKGGAWVPLDTWTANDTDFTAGNFGFYIPGNDEVGVSNFTFTPR